jgi:arylformamidase
MIYDISPPLTAKLAVWPGDVPLSRKVLCHGDPVTLSALRATAHLGAHADAPCHYGRGAASIDQCPLDWYLGPCQVMRVKVARGQCVNPEMLPHTIEAPRVLIATDTYLDPDQFDEDFAALAPELIKHLKTNGVVLVGIDTPSVDVFAAKDLPTHHACLEHGVAILEGLVLREVPAGLYELIALPLKLVGFDGSPVRAVLRTRDSK